MTQCALLGNTNSSSLLPPQDWDSSNEQLKFDHVSSEPGCLRRPAEGCTAPQRGREERCCRKSFLHPIWSTPLQTKAFTHRWDSTVWGGATGTQGSSSESLSHCLTYVYYRHSSTYKSFVFFFLDTLSWSSCWDKQNVFFLTFLQTDLLSWAHDCPSITHQLCFFFFFSTISV